MLSIFARKQQGVKLYSQRIYIYINLYKTRQANENGLKITIFTSQVHDMCCLLVKSEIK